MNYHVVGVLGAHGPGEVGSVPLPFSVPSLSPGTAWWGQAADTPCP